MTVEDTPEKDRRFATTLARGLSVLRAFHPSDDGLGNADIAKRTGLPKSTVSRLTFTLQALGYLNHVRRGDRYRPGPALLGLGNLANASMSFIDLSSPIMQALADETGALCVLAVRDNRKMLLVKTWRPSGVSSLWLENGHRVPFVGSSSGHTLLAALSDERFNELLDQVQNTINLAPELAHRIRAETKSQLSNKGFVIVDPKHYYTSNIHAVSVPYQPPDLGEPIVFSCGAMPRDLPLSRLEKLVGPALRSRVKELEAIMGQDSVLAETQREHADKRDIG